MMQWTAKELAVSRRDLDLQFEDTQDWAQREGMERRMGDSLLRWLGGTNHHNTESGTRRV